METLPECTGKESHGSRREALLVADGIRRRSGQFVEVYECRFCGRWHLTGIGRVAKYNASSLNRSKRRRGQRRGRP